MTLPLPTRSLGSTGLTVTSVTLGGSPLGNMMANYKVTTTTAQAIELVCAALDQGIRTIDTSNNYGDGESERRIGAALKEYGPLPAGTVIITKVDARGEDYSGDRVRASLAESQDRLGLDYLPVVHLHDPEFHDFDMMTAPGGAIDALVEARAAGQIGHIGLAGGDSRVMQRYLSHYECQGVFELLLTHNRWTLADRSSTALIYWALEHKMAVFNAAVHGGGILTDPARQQINYAYQPASAATIYAIEQMRQVCRKYGTDLGTAALRFSTRDSRFASTIVGLSTTRRLEATIAAATADLPDALWQELAALLPSKDNWVDA